MDESLKKKLIWVIIAISFIVLLISLIGNYNASKSIKEDYIAVNRSPLQPFRLIEYRETDDGVFVDIVGINNGIKYENNFISKTCPQGQNKKPGMTMQLSVVENMKTSTEETFYTLDRAYEYLCTNLNMAEEDQKLFKRINEAKDRLEAEMVKKP